MKKTMLIGAIFGMVMVFSPSGLASAADAESIYFETRETESSEATICHFYAPGIKNLCAATYGSYDATHNILTLKSGVNGKANGLVKIEGMNNLTITADADIETSIDVSDSLGINLILDFHDYSFTDTPYELTESSRSSSGEAFSNFYGSDLVIESGIFNDVLINAASLVVNGGVTNIREGELVCVSTDGDIDITDGEINVSDCEIAFSGGGDLNISGGVINVDSVSTGFYMDGDIEIAGGETYIKAAQTDVAFGISLNEGKNFTINDGELMIDGFDWGISGENSKIYFNGGITTIKNSKEHAVWIEPAVDPENDIVFAEGMGIKENTYVFWDDEEGTGNSTGIAGSEIVTIAEGYQVRRHYGWETIDEDDEDIKVPDTGMFIAENDGAMMMVASLGMLMAVAGGAYLVAYMVKRSKTSVKFNK